MLDKGNKRELRERLIFQKERIKEIVEQRRKFQKEREVLKAEHATADPKRVKEIRTRLKYIKMRSGMLKEERAVLKAERLTMDGGLKSLKRPKAGTKVAA